MYLLKKMRVITKIFHITKTVLEDENIIQRKYKNIHESRLVIT